MAHTLPPRTKQRCVVFDGDDTLWSTEPLYDQARSKARDIVTESGLNGCRWETLERLLDVQNVAMFGYGRERFPRSCVQAYEELCREAGKQLDPVVASQVQGAARTVFESDPPVVPEALETLTNLRDRGFRLVLLTKGDPTVQRRRVERSGLSQLFDVIRVVHEKVPSDIRDVVVSLDAGVECSWMVGNSVRSDILPAIAAGLRAVWINAHVWEHERSHDALVDDRVVELSCLAEVPAAVSGERDAA